MGRSKLELWQRFQKYYTEFPTVGLSVDLSRMNFPDDYFAAMEPRIQQAFAAMAELERGAIANPDENRMVGHYWLRNPALAPTAAIRKDIEDMVDEIESFAAQVHDGTIRGAKGPFKNLLLIGIGGSALGPQFVSNALGHPATDKLAFYSFDNTDPDGMDRVLAGIVPELGQTLCLVISKSGRTRETRNGMMEAETAYRGAKLDFGTHAIAITGAKSGLDRYAVENRWLKQFPMWDWVGGRTSELSAVGLVPAALQGFDIEQIISGASAMDEVTRQPNVKVNPAGQLALMWFYVGNGKGTKDMVVLPYKDQLELFSRYLQQLVMESLGKKLDLQGHVVNQGLAVYGNKGSTDQHSYIQQLMDGPNNFFVTFITVLNDKTEGSVFVEPYITSGDYLNGFLLGTRGALHENGRETVTITLGEVSPFAVGALIALFERSVGLYANLIGVNAYNQPGVEAGKTAAESIIALQPKVVSYLESKIGVFTTLSELTAGIQAEEEIEAVFGLCRRLAANPSRGIRKKPGKTPFEVMFQKVE